MKKLEELHSSCGVAVQPVEIPMATSMHVMRVQEKFREKEESNPRDKGVLLWHHGKEISTETIDGGINTTIE